MLDDGTIRDGGARLWPQTERIKGHMALALDAADPTVRDDHISRAAQAGRALSRYFDVDTPGLWRDRMEPDGRFRIEPAPASSFYHIVCGIEEFDKSIKALEDGAA